MVSRSETTKAYSSRVGIHSQTLSIGSTQHHGFTQYEHLALFSSHPAQKKAGSGEPAF